ncbi:MAG TPA: polyribonucleotide nucleotidyltransferase [bacterium]|nr:polyribonucleotide nucleotidyltransferase [bacterium]
MGFEKLSLEVGGKTLTLETGKWAKQAAGSVVVRYGDTVVLGAVTSAKTIRDGQDFFPLTVDYREKSYAAGKIPGGFFKREGKQRDSEILTCRLIDRPMRPLFPEGFLNEVAVSLMTLSSDKENESDIPAMIAASACVCLSDIPFAGPIGAVRIGQVEGQFVVNPTFAQMAVSELDLVVAATDEAIMMVEGGALFLTEERMLDALDLAHAECRKIVAVINDLVKRAGKPKKQVTLHLPDPAINTAVREKFEAGIRAATKNPDKLARQDAVEKLMEEAKAAFAEQFKDKPKDVKAVLEQIEVEAVRGMIAHDGQRPDGRGMTEVRPIDVEVGVLPRTHGSSLFTRGQTQALVVTTLGSKRDEALMEELEGESWKKYTLHYNFPSFSVGETKPNRGPGRREIGHGMLAERAIKASLPAHDKFPYTIRIVSEILESNGSSSMASVCGGSLSLMDAGVPVTAPVAGIAMGLIKEGDKFVVLTDIQGLEDHFGDMDFKVAGSKDGISAIQMDIKIAGLSREIMQKALSQAKEARLHILGRMATGLSTPREGLSQYAPQIEKIRINPEKIGMLIGPGGKNIKRIQEETKSQINIEEDGGVQVVAENDQYLKLAVQAVRDSVAEAEEGKTYLGKVAKIMEFGAFVTILPNVDGLCHISELADTRVAKVEDVVREGDEILVKCIGVDSGSGKIRLSRKAALKDRERV